MEDNVHTQRGIDRSLITVRGDMADYLHTKDDFGCTVGYHMFHPCNATIPGPCIHRMESIEKR